jgi:two-component system C4-dicarboxylate transport sensor histidine kinase DctB
LNNFATVVRTYSELLLSDLPADTPAHADVSEIHRAAEGMVHYLQRVTRFARAGNMRRTRVPVDEGITDAVAQFTRLSPTRVVHVTPAGADVAIAADALWWRDILAELLLNAHEAAPEGTPIEVLGSCDEQRVAVTVRDRGPGLPTALGDQVPEPFLTGKNGVRGAGMGLTLVASFVHALDGTLEIGRDGEITVVRLELPRQA